MHDCTNYFLIGEVDDVPADFDFVNNIVIFNSTVIDLNRGFVPFIGMVCQRMLSAIL